MQSYRELIVWQKSIDLVTEVYDIVKSFPKEEIYALSSQVRRAAVSIPSNIAEGHNRNYDKEFVHFLCMCIFHLMLVLQGLFLQLYLLLLQLL